VTRSYGSGPLLNLPRLGSVTAIPAVLRVRSVRLRLWWTTLLVLIALGGAGLAVAADRPQNPIQRPEVTWRAEQVAQPWIRELADDLALIDQDVIDISDQGLEVLGRLQSLDLEGMRTASTDGDEINVEMEAAIEQTVALRQDARDAIQEWRLGPTTRELFAAFDAATVAAQQVSAYWHGLEADAQTVAGLVDATLRHDGLVFRATTAGRQSRWDDALAALEEAEVPLADAASIRDQLAPDVDVETLDDLLGRYRAYDESLVALYTYVRDTGKQDGPAFDDLQAKVDQAQAALPADTGAMSAIVGQAAGPSITDALVAIEKARGDILKALAAADATINPPST
jgi:hypothetical protein